MLSGDGLNNEYALGAVNGDNAWNNRTHDILQLRWGLAKTLPIIVHILNPAMEKAVGIYSRREEIEGNFPGPTD